MTNTVYEIYMWAIVRDPLGDNLITVQGKLMFRGWREPTSEELYEINISEDEYDD